MKIYQFLKLPPKHCLRSANYIVKSRQCRVIFAWCFVCNRNWFLFGGNSFRFSVYLSIEILSFNLQINWWLFVFVDLSAVFSLMLFDFKYCLGENSKVNKLCWKSLEWYTMKYMCCIGKVIEKVAKKLKL